MVVTQQLENVIQLCRSYVESARSTTTIDEMRAVTEAFLAPFGPDEDIRWERADAGGVPAEWISAPGVAEDGAILYLHGGGDTLQARGKPTAAWPPGSDGQLE